MLNADGPARVLIVDDHPIVRQGLAQLIEQERDLTVCGEADDATSALTSLERLAPDAIILDLMLKGARGFDLIKTMRANRPAVGILVVSMHDENVYAERAIKAGAHGYIMKEEATQQVLTALRRVLEGEVSLSDRVVARILRNMVGGSPTVGIDQLSDRELEVFQWLGRGLTVNEIAEKLNISPKTIETYRSHIKDKMNLTSATDVVRVAATWLEQR